MTDIPKVFVVVLNYNGGKDTVDCLKSLFQVNQTNYNLSVIVVDNHSIDNSLSLIKPSAPAVIIENKENLGFTGGNNAGIKEALEKGADYILLLNNDTYVDKDLVKNLLIPFQKDAKIGIVSPKIYFAKGHEYHFDRYQESQRGRVIWYAGGKIDWQNIILSHRGVNEVDEGQYKAGETEFISGCAMMIKPDVLKKIGLFDNDYFLYLEDADLCQRAKNAGYKLWYEPSGSVWHKNAASSGKPGSSLHIYYQTRNRLMFGYKYAGIRTKFALLRESLKDLSGGGIKAKAVMDYYFRRWGRGTI